MSSFCLHRKVVAVGIEGDCAEKNLESNFAAFSSDYQKHIPSKKSHNTLGDNMSIDERTLWSSTTSIKSRPALCSDIECDVLVIGGGLAGVLTAYFLKQSGIDAVVVEASPICSGQTAKTTAKITSQHGACYSKIKKKFCGGVARAYANANEKAISDFERIIRDLDIDCDFERASSYLYAQKDTATLESEFAFTRECSIKAKLTRKTELPFSVKLALCYENQAQFNPYPFVSRLCDYISIFENTRVLRVEDNTAYCTNAKIKANKIVFATHYPIVNFPGLYFARMHQSRSYVVALKNATDMKSMYYCVDKGGLSFRMYKDLLLLSGGSHRCGELPKVDPFEHLLRKAREFYPRSQLCYSFSAQDCMTPDYLPYAGYYAKGKPDWYVLTGFSKWGMTNSMLCAKLVSDMITGQENSMENILSPSRFNLTTIKPVLNEVSHAVKNLTKSTFRIPLQSVADISRGDAKVVMYKGKRCGVYKSEEGELFVVSARCPHLGCALSFNKTEKTWECPCHGSRFSYKGELLDCPAQTSLKRYN